MTRSGVTKYLWMLFDYRCFFSTSIIWLPQGKLCITDKYISSLTQWKSFTKSVRIRSFSGSHFPAVGLNTEIYEVNLRIQSKCGKYASEKLRIRTLFTQWLRITLFDSRANSSLMVTLNSKASPSASVG